MKVPSISVQPQTWKQKEKVIEAGREMQRGRGASRERERETQRGRGTKRDRQRGTETDRERDIDR